MVNVRQQHLEAEFADVFDEFVGRFNRPEEYEPRRGDGELLDDLKGKLLGSSVASGIDDGGITIKYGERSHRFELSWQNGTRQAIEPLSLDYKRDDDYSKTWFAKVGLFNLIEQSDTDVKVTLVVSPPRRSDRLRREFSQTKKTLQDVPLVRHVFEEREFPQLENMIAEDLRR